MVHPGDYDGELCRERIEMARRRIHTDPDFDRLVTDILSMGLAALPSRLMIPEVGAAFMMGVCMGVQYAENGGEGVPADR
jgi:hypothetical protein